MLRFYVRLSPVLAAALCMINSPCSGSGIPCTRTDSNYQIVAPSGVEASALSSLTNPLWDDDGDGSSGLQHQTFATESYGASVNNGGNTAGAIAQITVSNPNAWGATGITAPQCSLAMGCNLSAHAISTDPDGMSRADLYTSMLPNFKNIATGTYQVQGTGLTGTFGGIMTFIFSFNPSGRAGVRTSEVDDLVWTITCGGSELEGRLDPDGFGWDVTGSVVHSGVATPYSQFWPVNQNLTLLTTQPAASGNSFEINIEVGELTVQADAAFNGPVTSGLVGSMSFSSAFSVQ